jgi:hypothetical protein
MTRPDDPTRASEPTDPTRSSEGDEGTRNDLREYLECWRLPGGRLAPEQMRALLAWSETPEEDRAGLQESLEATRQQVPARTLAPDQRRGHVSWIERLKGVFRS